jgi:hypothetical protein
VQTSEQNSAHCFCTARQELKKHAQTFNMGCFVDETKQTTLLPAKGLRAVNLKKARKAEEIAVSAQGKRSSARRSGPCSCTEVEELIGDPVRSAPGDGFLPLLPRTDVALLYKMGLSKHHVDVFNESAVLAADLLARELSSGGAS